MKNTNNTLINEIDYKGEELVEKSINALESIGFDGFKEKLREDIIELLYNSKHPSFEYDGTREDIQEILNIAGIGFESSGVKQGLTNYEIVGVYDEEYMQGQLINEVYKYAYNIVVSCQKLVDENRIGKVSKSNIKDITYQLEYLKNSSWAIEDALQK